METYAPLRFAQALRNNAFNDGVARSQSLDAGRGLTVNLTGLTAQEQGLARAALGEWRAITGIQFREVTGGADITYSHEGSAARTVTRYSGGEILSATVSIASARVGPGDGVGSYAFRTYMHETGHALGIGHPQDYASGSDFGRSMIANDSWQMSLMSYFSQAENTVIDADHAYNLTPMLADYLAVRQAYGAVPVRAGNTVYGVGSTAGGTLDQIATTSARVAFLIADTGGIDHISFAGDARALRLDLRPGAISDVRGLVGNMQIATDTVIENATGGRGNDHITGNAAGNRLDGGGGRDTLAGGAGNDTYVTDGDDLLSEAGGTGYDRVIAAANHVLGAGFEELVLTGAAVAGTGNALANRITGTAGANRLDGGAGVDTLVGGAGNDTYLVTPGDVVIEAAGGGTDVVWSAASHALAANVEQLVLTGAAAVNGTGNALANRITGNVASNRLDGGAGLDTLVGGAGDDTYFVTPGDVVIEAAAGGTDSLFSAASVTLAANVENGALTGTAAAIMTGNELANRLTGNAAANTLFGLGGNDVLIGGGGADRLHGGFGDDTYVTDAQDTIVELEGQGYDTCQTASGGVLAAGVERMILTGTAAANALGNAGDNMLVGNAAANRLEGGGGNDSLRGGGGADRFVFSAGVDRVLDFQNDLDTLLFGRGLGLSTVDQVMACGRQSGADVLFDFGAHDLWIVGVRLDDLRDDIALL